MDSVIQIAPVSKSSLWTSRILGGIATLFLIMDGAMKVFPSSFVIEATQKLGYNPAVLPGLGITLLLSTALYIIRRTSVLGALLLTGYLGGAIATNVRVGAPAFNLVFPLIVAAFLWGSLYLREERLRALLPLRS